MSKYCDEKKKTLVSGITVSVDLNSLPVRTVKTQTKIVYTSKGIKKH